MDLSNSVGHIRGKEYGILVTKSKHIRRYQQISYNGGIVDLGYVKFLLTLGKATSCSIRHNILIFIF